MFMCSYERNVQSVHNAMHHLGDASPLPIVGGKPTGPTCQSWWGAWCCRLFVWSLGSSWSRGPRATAPQEMDPVDGWAPALPYSLGLSSPSRHQQREVEGCNKHPDAASSDQPLEAGEMDEFLPRLPMEELVVVPCARFLELSCESLYILCRIRSWRPFSVGSLCLRSFEFLNFGQSGPAARTHSRGNFLWGAPCATAPTPSRFLDRWRSLWNSVLFHRLCARWCYGWSDYLRHRMVAQSHALRWLCRRGRRGSPWAL